MRLLLWGILRGLQEAGLLELSGEYNGVWTIVYDGETFELQLYPA